MATSFINGIQIDFQGAIIYNAFTGAQLSYEHVYFVRNDLVRYDINEATNTTLKDPCFENLCQNGGSCVIGFDGKTLCLCPDEYSGK